MKHLPHKLTKLARGLVGVLFDLVFRIQVASGLDFDDFVAAPLLQVFRSPTL
jgi:hypothetical protein